MYEHFHRGWYGETSWGKKIPFSWRRNSVTGLIWLGLLSKTIKETLGIDYSRQFFFGSGGALIYLSPPGQMAIAFIEYITASNKLQKAAAWNRLKKAGLPRPKGLQELVKFGTGETSWVEFFSGSRQKTNNLGATF